MLNASEKKLVAYTSAVIALLFNIFRLFSLRENAVFPRYWTFNISEFSFQLIWNFTFCFAIGWITVSTEKRKFKQPLYKIFYTALFYILILALAQAIGVIVQKKIFNNDTPLKIFRALYLFRLVSSLILESLLIRLFWLLEERKLKDKETEQLRNVYLTAQLELLKQQLNPHFFFNTLTNLSAVVREDSKKAQQYIFHLSKIFRYTLDTKDKSLVTVEEEISILNSYIELMKMRHEENINVMLDISESCVKKHLPHMSLQPLLENAEKHNSASKAKPLCISIKCNNDEIIVSNNVQPIKQNFESTGIGLSNLDERFKILTGKKIIINQSHEKFTVILPLI